VLLIVIGVSGVAMLFAQTTAGTGSIVGTVRDPSGATVVGARIAITNLSTGRVLDLTTNISGAFNSGALIPGDYRTRVIARGFKSVEVTLTVLVGNIATANADLEIGNSNEEINVKGSELRVNTEQPTVQGVLNDRQIENLPVNGRNFLDLAQLEPGVQIQDAANFGGGKDGYSSISFGGRFGRTARIEVDGIDVSDEIFGSTTTNIPASGIQEFQLSQSSLDLSTELTTSGAVNVTTRSGTNTLHGEAFGLFRDSSMAAALPAPPGLSEPFQRSQFGARLGGPVVKNKLFYFLDGERTLQHEQAPVLVAAPFQQYSGSFNAPFRENNLMARADYQLPHSVHAFYRFSYFQNSFVTDGGTGFSIYAGKNITRSDAAGFDFNTGTFSHSILGALRNHPRRFANGTFAEFSRESRLNSHIMHVTFGQVRSRSLQPLSDAVIAVRYTRICLQKIGGALRRTDEDRTRADPLTRLERLECKVAARNHTIKLRCGLSIAQTLRLGRELAHERFTLLQFCLAIKSA
jgi:Carboxypeptidase regulatory-like domain